MLLDALASPGHGVDIAERIRAALGPVFQLAEQSIPMSASIGVAIFPADGEDGEQLARAADRAMYRAKQAGGNQTRVAGGVDAVDVPGS